MLGVFSLCSIGWLERVGRDFQGGFEVLAWRGVQCIKSRRFVDTCIGYVVHGTEIDTSIRLTWKAVGRVRSVGQDTWGRRLGGFEGGGER